MSQTEQVQHTDSIERDDPNAQETKKTKSRRPANTAFRQQRLKAWQPILTPKTVLPLLFIVGLIFAPIGGLLIYASAQVEEIILDYTDCATQTKNLTNFEPKQQLNVTYDLEKMPSDKFTSYFKTAVINQPTWGHAWFQYNRTSKVNYMTNACVMEFEIPNNIGGPVLLYYRLTNFYQNHRRYVKSLDTAQLGGSARTASQINGGDCDPLKSDPETKLPYYPCGLIANSMFNDTIEAPYLTNPPDGMDPTYPMTNKGIAWGTDKNLYKTTKYRNNEASPPPNWRQQYPQYDDDTPIPDIHEWEEFQVWMRTAGLPSFSKLAMRNDTTQMRSGRYRLVVWDNFPVTKFGGTKSILISTRTVMGGKNPFLGIAYIAVGGICILMGAIFTATHLIKPRKLGDHRYLTWNNDQPSTATATGRSVRPE